jgi:hypothetical protein
MEEIEQKALCGVYDFTYYKPHKWSSTNDSQPAKDIRPKIHHLFSS